MRIDWGCCNLLIAGLLALVFDNEKGLALLGN